MEHRKTPQIKMSDAIEYCDDCPANVPCHMERKCLRPKCDNCGSPAVYRGYHWEAGAVYTCRDCAASHWADHTNMRKIWPPNLSRTLKENDE